MQKALMIGGKDLRFTPQQAASLANVPYATIDSWNRKGIVCPSVQQSQGRGKLRYYAMSDLVALRVLKDLRDAGLSLQALRKMLSELKALGYENPLRDQYLIAEGGTVKLQDAAGLMDCLRSPGQRVIVDYGAAVEEIREKVRELQAA
jgi:DNA-binding transcriptional MerR regulator